MIMPYKNCCHVAKAVLRDKSGAVSTVENKV